MPLMANGVQLDITALNNASPVIKQVAADVQGLETSAKDAGVGVAGASTEMESMTMTAASLGTAIGIVTSGISTMVAIFKAGEIAAANDRLRTSGEELATSYNSSLDSIIAKVREASLGTVSEMDIIASSNKAMMLGLGADADQLANLMEIAALRGRAMSVDTTQAFDDMVRGIGRMSPMILDNLGIVVDAEGTYARYAESIGKTSGELTRAEKIQALLNKVLEEGNKMLEESGGLADDAAAKYERWNAELENTKNYLLENTIEMSRFADMGSDLLVSFRDLADNGIGYGSDKLNLYSLFMEFGAARVAHMKEETWAALDATEAHGAALDGVVTQMQHYTDAVFTVTEVDAEAVKGAIKVQETYDKYTEKLSDLQLDHAELLTKKQELIDKGWLPESEKIQAVNAKLAENEQKQKDVQAAMQGTLEQMLLNTAAAGLDAEAQLELARATGQLDEAAYASLSVQQNLKKQYDDGQISAQEYTAKTLALRDAVAALQSKDIAITVTSIYNEIRNSYQNQVGPHYTGPTSGHRIPYGYAKGTDGWMTVPAGFPNDTYPVSLTSGERFAVIPEGAKAMPAAMGGMGGSGGLVVQFVINSPINLMDEEKAVNTLVPLVEQAWNELQMRGNVG